jgi:serine/threonine protein kinase
MVEREDLREMPDQIGGPLQETQILDWITQVCNALEYLHSHNPPIIHRDGGDGLAPRFIRMAFGRVYGNCLLIFTLDCQVLFSWMVPVL